MNLPSSLALPQSKLLRSPVGILVLVLAAALLGGGAYFALRAPAPTKLPTPATSPAAQTLVRPVPATPVPANAPGMFGPQAPAWVKRDLTVVPKALLAPNAAVTAAAPGTVVPGTTVPGATTATPGAPTTATATNVTATPVPGATTTAPVTGAAVTLQTAAKAMPGTTTSASTTTTLAPTVPVPGALGAVDETPKPLDANTLFQREQYVYSTAGRRDPFQSLIDGRFESQSGDASLVDVGDIHLVGIMWGSSDKFALVEDSRGRGFVLRVGDPVVNGYISGISKTELQVVQNAFGDSQTVTIQLKSKEGDNATNQ